MIYSKLLQENGLLNIIAGSEYDIRGEIDTVLKQLANQVGCNPKMFYTAHQIHTSNVNYADGISGIDKPYGKMFEETDGLFTDKSDIALVIKFADCTPILIYDPVKKMQAAVHSGWRGTVKEISKNAIELFLKHGSNISDLLCYIGPSIDMDNYEVGVDVYDCFAGFENRDEFFKPFGEKYKLSMIDANLDILLRAGIKRQNIEICDISTFTDKSLNSYRRDKENYKLNGIISVIK